MDKLRMESLDMTAQNIDRIAALFPNCITEMLDEEHSTPEKKVYKRAVNFELLKQMLSPDVVDGDEAYEFTWVGKKAAIAEANRPIRKTLRPCVAESKDWDTTENLYIEGDNLEVLKLLQESYLGKVKMIYIDPPYNTGNDFIYADDFMRSQEEENEQMGMYDEDENRLFKNTDTNGRFHSDWCSMIYSRLLLARNLLTDDGVIFISIDDNEQENLKKICDEVFGKENFLSTLVWVSGRTSAAHFTNSHEYIVAYAKKKDSLPLFQYRGDHAAVSDRTIKKTSTKNNVSDIKFPAGIDFECDDKVFPHKFGINEPVEIVEGTLECSNRKLKNPVTIRAAWTMRDMILSWLRGEKVLDQKGQIVTRFFFKENGVLQYEKEKGTTHPNTVIQGITTKNGSICLDNLKLKNIFPFPKPIDLIEYLSACLNEDSLILDFFSGSATTAHAVMQLNAEDGGHRKFIMVQLPEKCDEASEAYKAGYKNICEIGKERIRRAGDKIKSESPMTTQDLDIGFRVLKLDDTNMKDVYYAPDDYDQNMLAGLESNIKDDRTDLDLLFGCLIDWGLPLSLPYKSEQIDGCTVHTYNDGDLIACFDANIPESVVKEIAQRKPLRAVFRDSGFASSPEKINVFEIFKLYMPEDANDISKRVRVI